MPPLKKFINNIPIYRIGIILIIISFFIFLILFSPLLFLELKYKLHINAYEKIKVPKEINISKKIELLKPKDKNFNIIIPKLAINEKILPNVNPYDPKIYQEALKNGVAHAKGSALPNQRGNLFIFSHSVSNPLNVKKYNAVFYLLTKLEKGDEIVIIYNENLYKYKVKESKIVNSNEVKYLKAGSSKRTLTLMTCWPPGTDLKRLLIFAE